MNPAGQHDTNSSTLAGHAAGWRARAIFTDSHFLIPLAVFCIGLALLITLR